MKRWMIRGVLCSLLALLTLVSSAQVGVVAVATPDLTLRVGPGTEWRRIDVMSAGTTVALDGRNAPGDWARGITQNGKVGWMYAPLLEVAEGAVEQLPVIEREAPIQVPAPAPGSVPNDAPPAEQEAPPEEAASNPAPQIAERGGSGILISPSVNVNVRSGPGTDYRVAASGLQNQAFNADGRNTAGDWVRGVTSGGGVGWIYVPLLNITSEQLNALPVVNIDTPLGVEAPQAAAAEAPAEQQVASAAPPPVTSNTPFQGFSYGGHARGLSDQTVNAMRTAGMTWVKYQVRYRQGDDPGGAAGAIADAQNKGFRILLGVVGYPDEVNNGGYNEAYAGFVAGLAAAGADGIEIWNEPNLDREWPFGQIDPAMYTQLLAVSYNAIKTANPNTFVISGAPAPTGAEGAFPGAVMNDDKYVRGMVNAGALNYMDCLGAHYNEGIVPPTRTSGDPRSEYYTRYYPGMVNTYSRIINNRRPICFTELGYLTPEGYGPLSPSFSWASNVTVAQQAAWLDTVISRAAADRRVRLVIVWNVDFDNYGADPMAGFAMIRPGGACPACEALGN